MVGHAVIRARIGAVNARVGEYTVVAQTFTSQVSLEPAAVYKCREAVPFMLEKRDKQVPRVKSGFDRDKIHPAHHSRVAIVK